MHRHRQVQRLKLTLALLTLAALAATLWSGGGSSARDLRATRRDESARVDRNQTAAPAQPQQTPATAPAATTPAPAQSPPRVEGCISCHGGTEPMHRTRDGKLKADGTDGQNLSCTYCHGGNPFAALGESQKSLRRGEKEFDQCHGRGARPPALPRRVGGQGRQVFERQPRAHQRPARAREPRVRPLRQPRRLPRRRHHVQLLGLPHGRGERRAQQHDAPRLDALGRRALQQRRLPREGLALRRELQRRGRRARGDDPAAAAEPGRDARTGRDALHPALAALGSLAARQRPARLRARRQAPPRSRPARPRRRPRQARQGTQPARPRHAATHRPRLPRLAEDAPARPDA